MTANRFVLCNMAAKAARRIHNASKGIRFEVSLRAITKESEKFLTEGSKEELKVRNFREIIWRTDANPAYPTDH